MCIEDQKVVRSYLFNQFLLFVNDEREANEMADVILDDVIVDIEESADIEFNYSDIHLGMVRVVRKKFGMEV